MSAKIDLTGMLFGRLTVIGSAPSQHGRAAWRCLCSCGNEKIAIGQHLRRGVVTTCGCGVEERAEKMGKANRRHGKTNTPEFRTWTSMKSRCLNPKDYRFKDYGKRGIKVCERWMNSFEAFLEDMGKVPFSGAELDRRDNDLGYCKENCRWVTSKENNNNRRSNRYLTIAGEVKTMTQWAEFVGMNPATLRVRLESGMSPEDAISKPVR